MLLVIVKQYWNLWDIKKYIDIPQPHIWYTILCSNVKIFTVLRHLQAGPTVGLSKFHIYMKYSIVLTVCSMNEEEKYV